MFDKIVGSDLEGAAGIREQMDFTEVIGQSYDSAIMRPDQSINVCAVRAFRPHPCNRRTNKTGLNER